VVAVQIVVELDGEEIEGHVGHATVHEALWVTVTVDARGVIVVVAVQIDAEVDEIFALEVEEITELEVTEGNMHEQAELNFEGDALQADRIVGMPVVAIYVDARYGVQNEDAEEA